MSVRYFSFIRKERDHENDCSGSSWHVGGGLFTRDEGGGPRNPYGYFSRCGIDPIPHVFVRIGTGSQSYLRSLAAVARSGAPHAKVHQLGPPPEGVHRGQHQSKFHRPVRGRNQETRFGGKSELFVGDR